VRTAPQAYTRPASGRLSDLGYFIGYRLAKSYFEKAPDESAALREIIQARNVDEILRKSVYAP